MNIFDLPGPEFLEFYIYALIASFLWALLLPHLLRFPSDLPMNAGRGLHPFEIGYLADKKRGMWRTALVALWRRGLVAPEAMTHSFKRTAMPVPSGLHRIEEAALLRIGENETFVGNIYDMDAEVRIYFPRLLEEQLVLPARKREILRAARILPLVLLALAGLIKVGVGVWRDRPVAYLIALVALTLPVAFFFFSRIPYNTWRGQRLLRFLAAQKSALRYAFRRRAQDLRFEDEVLAAALFGPAAMSFGSAMAVALETPAPITRHLGSGSSSCGGSSCGGSSCGGGGGGGGCGGCGGGH